jgi:hypothetical protein
MTHSPTWDKVTDADVLRAIEEYDQLGPDRFFSEHGFGPTTTYDLDWNERLYPPKAILGTAYEFATPRTTHRWGVAQLANDVKPPTSKSPDARR